MKRLITSIAAASIAYATFAATTEELNAIPLAEVTQVNAAEVLDAALTVTNNVRALYVITNKLADAQTVHNACIAAKRLDLASQNAVSRKDVAKAKIVIATAVSNATTMANSEKIANCAAARNIINIAFADTTGLSITQKIVLRFGYAEDQFCADQARALLNSNNPSLYLLGELLSMCTNTKGMFSSAKDEVVKANISKIANAMKNADVNCLSDVFDYFELVYYFFNSDPALVQQLINASMLQSKFTEQYMRRCMPKIANAQQRDFIKKVVECCASSTAVSESFKIKMAKFADDNSKTTTIALYPSLTSPANKVAVALYLNDIDKLIDCLKTVDDSLDAAAVGSVIAPLNAVNAGYRTDDLRLALMNINKKYTLKLYDDRDAWEPILSKIRAMIDTL